MIEVFAEETGFDPGQKITVGGRHHAHLHAKLLRGANSSYCARLQDPQEPRLELERELTELVEEESAAVRSLEEPRFVGGGAGERAFDVPEELALDELCGQGAGVDGDERRARAGALIVDGAGDQLFAGAGFSRDQRAQRAFGDPPHALKHPNHRVAFADHHDASMAISRRFTDYRRLLERGMPTFVTRGQTPADLMGRCDRCWQRDEHCLCATIGAPLPNSVEILLLRHAKETFRTSNTGRVASLMLANCSVMEIGALYDDRGAMEAEFERVLAQPGRTNYLLYPSTGRSLPKVPAETIRLVVPDGSWRQARRMIQRVPGISGLPRVSVLVEDALRLRRPPWEEQMSTIEAIASVLGELDGPEYAARLRAVHRTMVENSLRVRKRSAIGAAYRSSIR